MTDAPRTFTPAERGVLRHFSAGPLVISTAAVLRPIAERLLDEGYLMSVGRQRGGRGRGRRLIVRLSNKGVDAVGDLR